MVGIVVVLVLGIYALVYWETKGQKFGSHSSVRSYYTDDDGQTYFAGAGDLYPPFDHDGKPAVRCYVFKCPKTGVAFVGYLEKYSDATRDSLDKPFDPSMRGKGGGPMDIREGTLVKRPGDKDWVRRNGDKGGKIATVVCPGTTDLATAVYP